MDPNPDTEYGSGSGSTTLGNKVSNLDGYPAGGPVRRNGGEDDKLDGVQLHGAERRPSYKISLQLQEKSSSLKREHPALENMQFRNVFYFCGSFLPSWLRIRIRIQNMDPNPDPDTEYGSGSGSTTLGNKVSDLDGYPAGGPVRGNGGEDDKLDRVQLDGVEGCVGLGSESGSGFRIWIRIRIH
jgi:hypothetical protein